MKVAIVLTLTLFAGTAESGGSDVTTLFGEITAQLDEKVEELFQQPFFRRLSNESIPIRRRMTFIPYWTNGLCGCLRHLACNGESAERTRGAGQPVCC